MKNLKKQTTAIILMMTSLIFLVGFLVLFLLESYKKEKENVQKEVGYLFVNSIRKIEGGILKKLVSRMDSSGMRPMQSKLLKKDSMTIKSIIRIANDNIQTNEEDVEIQTNKIHVEVSRNEKLNDLNQVEGSVAMFIALSLDSAMVIDSCISETRNNVFLQELNDNFSRNLKIANLSISYVIVKEKILNQQEKQTTPSASYTDISSGDKYLVQIENYGLLIFKKIIPELTFSILLFICIALAFYMVYKTLASERMLINLKNDFIQNITHELKTPIATVSVAMEALQEFNALDDQNKRSEYLDISKNELKRLSLLVDKVLNISQIEKEMPPIQLETLNLNQVIQEILNTLKLQFEKMNVQISFECFGEEFVIRGDRQRVDGLLYNLLDNAMKYNNSTEPLIHLQLMHEDGYVKMVMTDNGIGIPMEHQKSVFDKFYRVPQGNIHNVKGHGLGLSFAAQVVRELDGNIQLESEQTVGSTFIVKIPSSSIL